MTEIERKAKYYLSDLIDEGWSRIAPLFSASVRRERAPGDMYWLDNDPSSKAVPQRLIVERPLAWLTPRHFVVWDYE